ncbi:MAG: hypothetical protein P4L61_01925, partial [Candidatus Pacebacteria bacterium]|nr:hypothetical protein [Candidatus Paceibacterota bacterium]
MLPHQPASFALNLSLSPSPPPFFPSQSDTAPSCKWPVSDLQFTLTGHRFLSHSPLSPSLSPCAVPKPLPHTTTLLPPPHLT